MTPAEIADIVQGHLDNGDKLDAFTLQPAREALKGGGMSLRAKAEAAAGREHLVAAAIAAAEGDE